MKAVEAWNKTNLPNIIWVEFSPETRQQLIKSIPFKFEKENLNDKQSLHHVTLFFKPKENDIAFIEQWAKDNDEIKIDFIENCYNNDVQALRVRLFNSVGTELSIPNVILHTTVSVKKGIKPVESNNMLKGVHYIENITYSGTGILKYYRY